MKILFILAMMIFLCAILHFHSFKKQFVYIGMTGIVCIVSSVFIKDNYILKLIIICAVCVLITVLCLLEMIRFVKKRNISKQNVNIIPFFKDKKVLILVPHQDDELNICGGMIEQYVSGNSDVTIAFFTNGDCYGQQEFRMKEAIKIAKQYGIKEENVIFLGFGDQWSFKSHIYNAPDNALLRSVAGKTETYALDSHPAYINNLSYTRDNVIKSIKKMILDRKPDVIYCNDYDIHADHRALSLFFEEAICEILKTNNGYSPIIYKAFAYSTAFFGKDDFYSRNLISTSNLNGQYYMTENNIYNWGDRVRIPVSYEASIPLLMCNRLFHAFELYESQRDYLDNSRSIINSDKVFWKRRTDSVLYDAIIEVSSGNSKWLNDFKYIESKDVYKNNNIFEQLWHPQEDDNEKEITIILPNPKMIKYVSLYDNPSFEDNILEASITINNEKVYNTGKLISNGSETRIYLDEITLVNTIQIKILEYEGNNYGLTEIEAYANEDVSDEVKGKIVDDEGNFVYNYVTSENGLFSFDMYSTENNKDKEFVLEYEYKEYPINIGKSVSLSIAPGKKSIVKLYEVKTKEKELMDTVCVSNPSKVSRVFYKMWEMIDSLYIKLSFSAQIHYYKALWIHAVALINMKMRNK